MRMRGRGSVILTCDASGEDMIEVVGRRQEGGVERAMVEVSCLPLCMMFRSRRGKIQARSLQSACN